MNPVTIVFTAAFLMLSGSLFANLAVAHSYTEGQVTIDHPWSRPTPPGTPTGVGYMIIINNSEQSVTLVSGATPAAAKVTIHQSRMEDGLMTMEHLPDGLVIPAGDTVELKPHSYHLMLEYLNGPFAEGQRIPLTLTFDEIGDVEVELVVEPLDDTLEADQSAHRHGHDAGH